MRIAATRDEFDLIDELGWEGTVGRGGGNVCINTQCPDPAHHLEFGETLNVTLHEAPEVLLRAVENYLDEDPTSEAAQGLFEKIEEALEE